MLLPRNKRKILFLMALFLMQTSTLHGDGWNNNNTTNNEQETWNPFTTAEKMQKEMDRMIQDSFDRFNVLTRSEDIFSRNSFNDIDIDLEEKEREYVLKINTKELKKDKIEIEMNKSSITVSGEYSAEEETTGPDMYISSQQYSSFSRTIPMPEGADMTGMTSEQNEDFLTIRIPKK